MYYVNYFFIMSIIGHILESFVYKNGESGILYGWWTPVYGFGTVIILLLYCFLSKKLKPNKITKLICVFLIGSILLTALEAIGGYLIEWIFNITFWDYSHYRFHIGKYIALEVSLIWGLSSILIVYFIKPLLDKIISKIPKYLTYSLIVLIVWDFMLTLYTLNLK